MRASVEPVAPNAVALIKVVRDGVEKRFFGKRLMKGGVEDRDMLGFSKASSSRTDAEKTLGIVQRSEGEQLFNLSFDVGVDHTSLAKSFSTVNHAMSDRDDTIVLLRCTKRAFEHHITERIEGVVVSDVREFAR